jgi:hypothetical protein
MGHKFDQTCTVSILTAQFSSSSSSSYIIVSVSCDTALTQTSSYQSYTPYINVVYLTMLSVAQTL